MNFRILLAAWLAGLVPAAASADQHVFWEVSGEHNTVYLLGSVHVMRSADASLPKVAEAAYRDAEAIVEELNPFAVTAEITSAASLALQALPAGQTLAEVLGEQLHERLRNEAVPLNIDIASLARKQPWYVALMVMQARLAQGGFSSGDGVDNQIAMRAQRDGKPLRGLESAVDQFRVFAGMSGPEQIEFLRTTLDEDEVAGDVEEITRAWRNGDLKKLESLLRSGAEESPEFFKALTTDRNLKWLPQIEAMLVDSRDDYLVVTGALHMVGEEGLVELLRRKGYKVKRR